MHIFATGGTGFVGRALVARLRHDGHTLALLTRDPTRPAAPGVHLVALDADLRPELARADAVVNLAGANLFEGRWTARRKQALVASRVDLTRRLTDALDGLERPTALVSASAVGYYGDRGDEVLAEDAPPGDDFPARLCRDWEAAAERARGVRVARLRIGLVLGPGGGALERLRPLFRLGLGGRIGDGHQWVSWIQLDDLTDLIARALTDADLRGPLNAVAPNPVTNRDFTAALARAAGRPARIPVPALALRLALGEAAGVLLGSQRAVPRALEARGHVFRHPHIDGALAAG